MLNRRPSIAIELRLRAQARAQREAQNHFKIMLLRFMVGLCTVVATILLVATDVLARESNIEEVHEAQLVRLISANDFVAVFWHSRNCDGKCEEILEDLESLDDDTRRLGVQFVRVADKRLAKARGIQRLPALTLYSRSEMKVFGGDLGEEDDVLDFLTSESALVVADKIEQVNAAILTQLITTSLYVAALFHSDDKQSMAVLTELEKIDDEADVFGIRLVKINDPDMADDFSLDRLPSLAYFRRGIPVVYDGDADDLKDGPEVLEWLIKHQTTAEEEDMVESVGEKELDILVENVDHLLVLFHDRRKMSQQALDALETVDDDCDQMDVAFVKVDNHALARKHGVADELPSLVYFENRIPTLFDGGDIADAEDVLRWLRARVEDSHVEEVAGEMLEQLVAREKLVGVVFYEKGRGEDMLKTLEMMDGELESMGVLLVKNSEKTTAEDFGIEQRPELVLFKRGIPNVFGREKFKHEEALSWIASQVSADHSVEVVTDAMLQHLIQTRRHVAVFFYQRKRKTSTKALETLETIGVKIPTSVPLVKIDDAGEAEDYGIERLPALVLFENAVPDVFDGDLSADDGQAVLEWLTSSSRGHNIEEVNPRMLRKLVEEERQRVAVFVYFKDVASDVRLLQELEAIDGELAEEGIHLVKLADDGSFAEEAGLDVTPALLVYGEDGMMETYAGDLGSETKVAEWIRQKMLLE